MRSALLVLNSYHAVQGTHLFYPHQQHRGQRVTLRAFVCTSDAAHNELADVGHPPVGLVEKDAPDQEADSDGETATVLLDAR